MSLENKKKQYCIHKLYMIYRNRLCFSSKVSVISQAVLIFLTASFKRFRKSTSSNISIRAETIKAKGGEKLGCEENSV